MIDRRAASWSVGGALVVCAIAVAPLLVLNLIAGDGPRYPAQHAGVPAIQAGLESDQVGPRPDDGFDRKPCRIDALRTDVVDGELTITMRLAASSPIACRGAVTIGVRGCGRIGCYFEPIDARSFVRDEPAGATGLITLPLGLCDQAASIQRFEVVLWSARLAAGVAC